MKILVTGGAGFIGSHILDLLADKGHDLVVIDNLSHGKKENINPAARFYHCDIRDKDIEKIFQIEKPEVLIHHAAQIKVPVSVKDPIYDAEVNIVGTINLLEASRKYGVKKVIYPASAAIFGEPEYLPIDEKHSLNMISGYGVSKHTVEHYLGVYRALYGMNYIVLRYSNVYGPRQDSTGEGGVVSIFCESIAKDLPLDIFGDGEQIRDFVYVKDVARANLLALKGDSNGIYNVCSNKKVTINDLISLLEKISGKNLNKVHLSKRDGDIEKSYMTYEKIKGDIGWTPKITLEEGLKETLAFYATAK